MIVYFIIKVCIMASILSPFISIWKAINSIYKTLRLKAMFLLYYTIILRYGSFCKMTLCVAHYWQSDIMHIYISKPSYRDNNISLYGCKFISYCFKLIFSYISFCNWQVLIQKRIYLNVYTMEQSAWSYQFNGKLFWYDVINAFGYLNLMYF